MAAPLAFLLIAPILLSLIGSILQCRWVKLRKEPSFLIAVATALVAVAVAGWRLYQIKNHTHFLNREQETAMMLGIASTALLITFATPFGVKLYRSWIGIQASPEEKTPGTAGVRAWLAPGNLIVAALIAACAAGAYDCQFLGVFALLVACLLIQPSFSPPVPLPHPPLTPRFPSNGKKSYHSWRPGESPPRKARICSTRSAAHRRPPCPGLPFPAINAWP